MEVGEATSLVVVVIAEAVLMESVVLGGFWVNSGLVSVDVPPAVPELTVGATFTVTFTVLLLLGGSCVVSVQVTVEPEGMQFHAVEVALVAVTPVGRVSVRVTGASRVTGWVLL